MTRKIALLTLLIGMCSSVVVADTILELRQEYRTEKSDGLPITELTSLSERALALANAAGERGKFWSAIGFVAELCETESYAGAVDIRSRALRLLVQRFNDTRRWSKLLTYRFAPVLANIPREHWRQQIKTYAVLLDGLSHSTTNERIKAQLAYAKVLPWVQINRRWDWLTDEDRFSTLQKITNIQDQYGTIPSPGSRGDHLETVGDLAASHEYELRILHFKAHAPHTAGTDLKGDKINLADYKGKIILLDFWTSFCAPCLAMVPDTKNLLLKYSDQPVAYVGVNGDAERKQGRRTEKRFDMTWRNIWDQDPHGPLATTWGVSGSPTLFVIDGYGLIRYKFRGKDQIESGLESAINTLLAERRLSQP